MTQKQQVLHMLKEAGMSGVTSNAFYACHLPRFSARLHELRNEGYEISTEPVADGHFVYKLRRACQGVTVDPPTEGNPPPSDTSVGHSSSLPGSGSTGFSFDRDSARAPISSQRNYYEMEEMDWAA